MKKKIPEIDFPHTELKIIFLCLSGLQLISFFQLLSLLQKSLNKPCCINKGASDY